ncbi:glycoside hydrolase family 65 protein [Brevundimonas viscosa]|uniref:Trehalose and maltose hydrolase (Possible phosphorylase) n=1 Tax=Brevundimonas viscosa TaxID=871741 RepID=A0A1I6NSH5_9CAUL|nr:glycoside hydrolase family 65 protein [Brevundimonas viscosa]SFS30952.1 Trehalose and maltose hydrolase (possible phosphorylase) [Brevundimonas viscosa]
MDPHLPISPPPARGPRGADLPAYVSNGLVGLRVRENPWQAGMCIVSGFAGEHHETRVEAAAAGPYPLGGDIALDGLWASDQPQAVEPLEQAYDFATGELTSRLAVRIRERRAEVEIVTFASRTHPTVVCQQVTVEVDAACDLMVRSRLDVDGLRGRMLERRLDTPGETEPVCDGSILWESEGALGRLGLAMTTSVGHEAKRTQEPWDQLGPLSTTWTQRAAKGRPLRFHVLTSLVPDVMHHQPHRQAVRMVAMAGELGLDELRRRNRAVWRDLWRGRIRLVGAEPKWQAMADAAFFYLNSSVHSSSPSSTSIYGLATWRDHHYYFGHVMWDVDAFAIPPLALMQPDAARAMLEYRFRGLPAARRNAQLLGRLGVQFPWEAGPLAGEEAAPGGASAAAREDHINLHVARAFAWYADVTGDVRFLRERAWPVVSGVADWFVDRVDRGRAGYDLRGGGGPAERKDTDDNDAMTLMAARILLERAARLAEAMDLPPPDSWRTVAKGLHLPMRADGVIASHDGYRSSEEKGATPSPLMGFFPFWADVDEDTRRRTLAFYLGLWRDYVGSPMLPALYGAWAAWAGDRDLSLKLLDEGYGLYQYGRFQQTLEYRLDLPSEGVATGPFFANMGGFVTGLLFGLPGLKVTDADPEQWPSRPVVLPAGWEAIECDRLWVRGRPCRLRARQGAERAELMFATAP